MAVELSETGLISVLTIVSAIIGLSLRMCLKSRCQEVSIAFGCIKVHRNVELESAENQPPSNTDLEMNNIYRGGEDEQKIAL